MHFVLIPKEVIDGPRYYRNYPTHLLFTWNCNYERTMKARAEALNMSLQFHIGGLVKDCCKAGALQIISYSALVLPINHTHEYVPVNSSCSAICKYYSLINSWALMTPGWSRCHTGVWMECWDNIFKPKPYFG